VGGAVGNVVPGLGHHDLSADALKAREAAVESREDACKVRCRKSFYINRRLFDVLYQAREAAISKREEALVAAEAANKDKK
jgi:hypothetical protein